MTIEGAAEPPSSPDFLSPPPAGPPADVAARESIIVRRVVARVIDWMLASVAVLAGWFVGAALIVVPRVGFAILGYDEWTAVPFRQVVVWLAFGVPFLWELAWLSLTGSTPGKKLLRLRVITEPDRSSVPEVAKRVPVGAAARRATIGFYIGLGSLDVAEVWSLALIGIYLLSMVASTNQRTFLDCFAGTRVVLQDRR